MRYTARRARAHCIAFATSNASDSRPHADELLAMKDFSFYSTRSDGMMLSTAGGQVDGMSIKRPIDAPID